MALGRKEMANRFGTTKPIPGGAKELLHLQARERFYQLGIFLDENLPDGRHKDLALDHVQTASMYAQKSIAELGEDFE